MIRRAIGVLASVLIICGGAGVLQSRAADEDNQQSAVRPVASVVSGPMKAAAAESLQAKPLATKPPDTTPPGTTPSAAKPSAAKPPAPGAPQVPEESATIRDDPTIAPDPKQSADNNVSFPNDI